MRRSEILSGTNEQGNANTLPHLTFTNSRSRHATCLCKCEPSSSEPPVRARFWSIAFIPFLVSLIAIPGAAQQDTSRAPQATSLTAIRSSMAAIHELDRRHLVKNWSPPAG